MINQKIPVVVNLSTIIFFYCLLALLNTGSWGQVLGLEGKAASHFNWYVNDMSYAMRLMIVLIPLLVGATIEYNVGLLVRLLFFGLIISNFVTIIFDYMGPDGSNVFDDAIYYPKLVVLLWLLIFGGLNREDKRKSLTLTR